MYNRTKVAKICLVCGKAFVVPPTRKDTARYCSRECQYLHQMKHKIKFFNCAECSKEFSLSPSHASRNKKTFCSMICNGKFYGRLRDFSGDNNPSWKGGVTSKHILIRTSAKYAEWRWSIFKRDNYTCVLCGQRGGELNADHIKAFAKFPELIFELDNGRTLCIKCHRKTDNYGFKGI